MIIQALETFLAEHFENIEHRAESKLFRAQLTRRGRIAAVFFFDYSESIVDDAFDLTDYQERAISADYYKNSSSIQWNLNLVFVLTADKYQNFQNSPRKPIIEADRDYCRKQICDINDLGSLFPLSAKTALGAEDAAGKDIAIRWSQQLVEAGLGEVISETPIAQVVRRIIDPPPPAAEIAERPLTDRSIEDPAGERVYVEKLAISAYRRKPAARTYPLGDVNILPGPNGIGKTSFLEAIELCLCGKTFRSGVEPDSSIRYWVRGTDAPLELGDGDNHLYQSRDLRWYNNRYARGNNLHQGFNKFNFYDTDQAYRLAHKTDPNEIRAAFTSLALGERVNFFEERIREVRRKLKDELSRREEDVAKITSRLHEDQKEIIELTNGLQQPEPILAVLQNELRLIPWSGIALDEEHQNLPIIEAGLLEAQGRIQGIQGSAGAWLQPISRKVLADANGQLQALVSIVSDALPSLDSMERSVSTVESRLQDRSPILDGLERVSVYAKSANWEAIFGMGDRLKRIETALDRLEFIRMIVAAVDIQNYRENRANLEIHLRDLRAKTSELVKEQDKVNQAIVKAKEALDKMGQLMADLRQIGLQVITQNGDDSKCPLCNASYATGELKHRIDTGSETTASSALEALISRRAALAETLTHSNLLLAEAKAIQRALHEHAGTQPRANLDLAGAVAELDAIFRQKDALLRDKEEIIALRDSLAVDGLSESELLTLEADLTNNLKDFSLRAQNADSLVGHLGNLKVEVDGLRNELVRTKEERTAKVQMILMQCQPFTGTTDDIRKAAASVRSKAEQCQRALEDFQVIERSMKLEETSTLGDLQARVERSLRHVKELKQVVADTQSRTKAVQLRLQAMEKGTGEMRAKEEPILRIRKALEPIEDIVKNDSKEKALETFFVDYKEMILKIFRAIHSPRQFEDISISESDVTLRDIHGQDVSLNKISTGQRAALALSIFLALNASLQKGPSVVLIDDPVANVDDINCVAFLDFLREFVIGRDRQLFFATANSRLANLFTKKFDFLGEKLVTVSLLN